MKIILFILIVLTIFGCKNAQVRNPFRENVFNERIHVQKCKEYQAAVYDYISVVILVADGARQKIPIDKCGHTKVPLIVGGVLANSREFPHSCLVGFNSANNEINWACGGTLISDRYVLTAAHCTFSRELGEPFFIRCGDLDLSSSTDDAKPEEYYIEKIIPHPEYRISNKYNDIALLKLDRTIKLNPYIRPACLPNEFNDSENHLIATGWGKTEWGGEKSSQLQKVILEKFTNSECNQIYSSANFKNKIQDSIQFCAGSHNEEKDTCQGDSGGPVQTFHNSEYCMYTVIGITSYGLVCGTKGVPGVYTRVFPYIDWIEGIVWNDSN